MLSILDEKLRLHFIAGGDKNIQSRASAGDALEGAVRGGKGKADLARFLHDLEWREVGDPARLGGEEVPFYKG